MVLDTNVVISALLFGGLPRVLVELALEGVIELATSPALEEELARVLRRKFPHHHEAIRETVTALHELAFSVTPRERLSLIRDDPDDNRVLECAVSAHADTIVSGDRHLLACGMVRGIPVLSPRAFLARRRPANG